MGYVTRFADSSAPPKRVRVGVGGRWSASEMQKLLENLLEPSRWIVRTSDVRISDRDAVPDPAGSTRLLEIVQIGDGQSFESTAGEFEELDAIVISPLTKTSVAISDDRINIARRHLARFVRQLKPGGATIFAADDPASDVFSAIRLDCRRLGYAIDRASRQWRVDRCDPGIANRSEPAQMIYRVDSMEADSDSIDHSRMELAAMATIEVLGLFGSVSPDQPFLSIPSLVS